MSKLLQTPKEGIREEIEILLQKAFAEDYAFDDITTKACIAEEEKAVAHLLLKQDACLAGLKFIPWIFYFFDNTIETEIFFEDGEFCPRNTVLAKVSGPARAILSAERVALNLLQHLSGIATLTHACIERVKGTKCEILDTRKTILGLRALQKYAVKTGGGVNHRPHLAGGILIKNNHLALAAKRTDNPIGYTIQRARLGYPLHEVEVEISSFAQLAFALEAKADRILLDNMKPSEVKKCVEYTKGSVYLEASGGITLDSIYEYAMTGVDGISLGALTHSVKAIDIALRLQ